ncbi:MAG: ChaN family lipoprotein [Planctomycetes bacterium]|nr:ChaN family lipoprotein [Planctomycetota bacterium]
MSRFLASFLAIAFLSLSFGGGCAAMRSAALLNDAAGSGSLVGQYAAFTGEGKPITLRQAVDAASWADAVFFGEEHVDSTCNQIEAQMLGELARQWRPVSLAMEFFETDTQPPLNAYLASSADEVVDEKKFRKDTRQGRQYATSHRPLIELCRAAGMPVIAANAPRRLVRDYRKSELEYSAYLATLPPEDRALLPSRVERVGGRYWDDFLKVMSSHGDDSAAATASQPSDEERKRIERAFLSQCMWDDAMSESVARHRDEQPDRRVMLIVGGFHVSWGGGTLAKFKTRRPGDRVFTVLYRGTHQTPLKFDPDDRDVADVVIYGIQSPPEPPASAPASGPASQPESAPASQPESAPASQPESAPASQPASAPAGD